MRIRRETPQIIGRQLLQRVSLYVVKRMRIGAVGAEPREPPRGAAAGSEVNGVEPRRPTIARRAAHLGEGGRTPAVRPWAWPTVGSSCRRAAGGRYTKARARSARAYCDHVVHGIPPGLGPSRFSPESMKAPGASRIRMLATALARRRRTSARRWSDSSTQHFWLAWCVYQPAFHVSRGRAGLHHGFLDQRHAGRAVRGRSYREGKSQRAVIGNATGGNR